MSELDFEAIGRCEHLKGQISSALRDRDIASSRVNHATRSAGGGFFQERIQIIDIAAIEAEINILKESDNRLKELVAEYNTWAKKAGKSEIVFAKY